MNKWIPTTDLVQLRRLGKLGEELGEASCVASRCIIQGIDEVDPGTGRVNRKRLEDELADVQAQIGCTVLAFGLDQDRMARRTADKMRQMAEWEAMFAPHGVAGACEVDQYSSRCCERGTLGCIYTHGVDAAHRTVDGPCNADKGAPQQ